MSEGEVVACLLQGLNGGHGGPAPLWGQPSGRACAVGSGTAPEDYGAQAIRCLRRVSGPSFGTQILIEFVLKISDVGLSLSVCVDLRSLTRAAGPLLGFYVNRSDGALGVRRRDGFRFGPVMADRCPHGVPHRFPASRHHVECGLVDIVRCLVPGAEAACEVEDGGHPGQVGRSTLSPVMAYTVNRVHGRRFLVVYQRKATRYVTYGYVHRSGVRASRGLP